MYRSDSQRKAMFAAMQTQSKSTALVGRPALRRKGFISRTQGSLRSWAQTHPILAETAIAAPAFALSVAASKKFRALSPIVKLATGGKLKRLAVSTGSVAANVAAYGWADSVARHTAFGKQPQKINPVASLIGGSIGASLSNPRVALTTAVHIGTSPIRAAKAIGRTAVRTRRAFRTAKQFISRRF